MEKQHHPKQYLTNNATWNASVALTKTTTHIIEISYYSSSSCCSWPACSSSSWFSFSSSCFASCCYHCHSSCCSSMCYDFCCYHYCSFSAFVDGVSSGATEEGNKPVFLWLSLLCSLSALSVSLSLSVSISLSLSLSLSFLSFFLLRLPGFCCDLTHCSKRKRSAFL